MANILVIEDENILAKNICDALGFAGHDASTVRSGEEGVPLAESDNPDVILLDYRLPGIDGLEVLRKIRESGVSAAIIMMTAHGNIDIAVNAMKTGASDFMTKPLDLKELQLTIERVLEHRRMSGELAYFRDRERASSTADQIIGESEPMEKLKQLIGKIVATPALAAAEPPNILITGETGTGKDLLARAIHYAGPRKDGPFVHVNCTALPDHLVEAELFGHVKGAFTDAKSDKQGLLECADGGTAFLDEIGHMPLVLQAKLLQSLESRIIRPVGGTREKRINVHFISATNRGLDEAIEQKEFREDLYHRLRTLSIHLVPLRERGDDAILLANHFLTTHAARFNIPVKGFTEKANRVMTDYDWPGNVRELAHAIESAVLMADGPMIRPEHLNIQPTTVQNSSGAGVKIAGGQTINIDFNGKCPTLDDIEHQIIKSALEFSKHNLSRASRLLGISRDAIRYRMEKFEKQKGNN